MISRGTFSGGKAVAEELAARLNYPCISNEVIYDAAEEFGVPEQRLNIVLQEPPRAWRQRPGRRLAHMNFVRAALLKRASSGNLVYHGYAGHLLLPEVSHVIRVRIIADMAYRIKAAMQTEGLTKRQALEEIKQLDNKAMKWTQALYGVQWQDPALYDLVLNLNAMEIPSAVDLIVHTTQLPDFQPTPKSLEAFENLLLSSLVWAQLASDRFTKTANVRVTSDKGIVTITGEAGSHKIVPLIPLVAQEVPGVREVRNEVGVGTNWMW